MGGIDMCIHYGAVCQVFAQVHSWRSRRLGRAWKINFLHFLGATIIYLSHKIEKFTWEDLGWGAKTCAFIRELNVKFLDKSIPGGLEGWDEPGR